ncbi:DUF1870 family protein [Mycobacteroides abscessus]|uniref:XRE family transcriptional regulator n=1 Tax=Mycobacteroides abscessus subsp. abscessus TaxID=1185650 RepID=A0AB38D2S0_9MYCO|nr:DUF1870 family protein [Mycobacteroides abscessus]MBE5419554.1 hypothetical protein [Mycobacteroides abscessus]MBE5455747.1 hypothetical protein [Mycobacteroides abscessus]MBN7463086.1 DUF1870 family protein [Mycobacteroides abscessus subsp. abscessus]MBN7555237.1 DUF1870 family protein [Mycobacteroides abscessus subsp. abscessus]MDM2404629.1 DUF1870 family protein [Mycobacteroides abscessus]
MTYPTSLGSAHLRTMREAAGQTMQAAADLAGVSLRTWQYWESPDSTGAIKEDVFALLDELLQIKASRVADVLDTVEDLDDEFENEDGSPALVSLVRYRSQEHLDRVHPGYPGGIGLQNAILAVLLEELRERVVVSWAPEDPQE